MKKKKCATVAIGATIIFAAMAIGIFIGGQTRGAILRVPSEPAHGIEAPDDSGVNPSSKIHLNTATEEELMTLPSIGEKRAKAIVQYREDIGGFQSLYQLEGVKGIGEKILEQILPYLTLE